MIDYVLEGYPGNEQLWELAIEIDKLHEHDEHEHYESGPRREMKGLVGARRLAYETGGKMDMRLLPHGDRGVDQKLMFVKGVYPADVKCAVKTPFLLVPVETLDRLLREEPDQRRIFILAQLLWEGDDVEASDPMTWDAELLRWNWDVVLLRSTPRYFKRDERILNYWWPRDDCRRMDELFRLLVMKRDA